MSTSKPSGSFLPGWMLSNGGKSLSDPTLRPPDSFSCVLKSTPFAAAGACDPAAVTHAPIVAVGIGVGVGLDPVTVVFDFAHATAAKHSTPQPRPVMRAFRVMVPPQLSPRYAFRTRSLPSKADATSLSTISPDSRTY